MPNGYKQTEDAFFSELSSYIVWGNNTGSQIKLQQLLTGASTVFDSENGKVKEKICNDINVLFCDNGHSIICFWSEHGYYFELIYPSNLSEKYMHTVIGRLVSDIELNQKEDNLHIKLRDNSYQKASNK